MDQNRIDFLISGTDLRAKLVYGPNREIIQNVGPKVYLCKKEKKKVTISSSSPLQNQKYRIQIYPDNYSSIRQHQE